MERRHYLAGVGVGISTIAGCSAVNDMLESEEYEEGDREALLPDSVGTDWPDEDFQPNHDLNENFGRVWTNPEETIAVMMSAEIYESVSEAEDSFDRAEATASDPNDYPMADEGIVYDDGESARCIFRDSNALGQTVAIRQSGLEAQPDRQRATTYAELMYQEWPGNEN